LLSVSFYSIEADSAQYNVGSDLLSLSTKSLQQKDITDLLSVNCVKFRASRRMYCVIWLFGVELHC